MSDASGELNQAKRLLEGILSGSLDDIAMDQISDQIDPVLLASVLRYLRDVETADAHTGAGVLERVLRYSETYPQWIAKAKKGEKDSVFEWFCDTHSFREFRGKHDQMLDLIWEKLES